MKLGIYLTSVLLLFSGIGSMAQNKQSELMNREQLAVTSEWDKTFPKSNRVKHCKVTFVNRFGITLVADMYEPQNAKGKLPAIAISGPYGAVKEQASGLYAQHLAEQGYLTIAFDPSFTGESGGMPRYSSSMDINTEDFCAAVDFLSCHEQVDAQRIGILGICGWGGIALNATALDPRIKTTVCVTLYNMTRVTQQGYFDGMDEVARHQLKQKLADIRTEEYRTGEIKTQGGLPEIAPADAPNFFKQYIAYYKSKERGYHSRSLNSNMGWNITSQLMLLNHNLWVAASEISAPVLIVHGEKAHSRYFGEDAFRVVSSGKYAANKHLLIVPGATHCDLYDGGDGNFIPWQDIISFYDKNLKYAGCPKAWAAFRLAKDVWAEDFPGEDAKAAFQREMIFPIGEPNKAYAKYFIGNSYLAPVSQEQVNIANVTFEPRCRNNWHIHKATKGGGQMLIGVAGRGWYQEEGKPAVEILPGTVIHIPAGVKHWHGAAADSWFSHLAFELSGENTSNEWLAPVTDEEYENLK